jgi:formate-dependent nitrite reductase membrane component NrfD
MNHMPAIQKYHQTFADTEVRQTQWAEGKGLLLVLAMYTGAIGAATYVLGMALQAPQALVVGWILAVVGKGFFHLIFLGRPARFWRALKRPHKSWLSRGVWAVGLFAILGGVYASPALRLAATGAPEVVPGTALYVVVIACGLFLLGYDGFLLQAAVGIPLWSKGLMPLLFPVFGLLAGGGLLSIIDLSATLPAGKGHLLEIFDQTFLLVGAVVLVLTLALAARRSPVARDSALELTRGFARAAFWVGVVFLCIVLPALSVVLRQTIGLPVMALGVVALLSVVGEFFVKYTMLSAGIYPALYPREEVKRLLAIVSHAPDRGVVRAPATMRAGDTPQRAQR